MRSRLIKSKRASLAGVLSLALTIATQACAAERVPEFQGKNLEGHRQKLSSLRGSVVVISFWATWCAPCREELPRLSALREA